MWKFEKNFREEHPETIGETNRWFDVSNYMDWLEEKLEQKNNILNISRQRYLNSVENICSCGLECGLEDVRITNKYEAMQYGFDNCKEMALEAIDLA